MTAQNGHLKTGCLFGLGSRPGVWTRYPLELAGIETTVGVIEAVTFGTNLCNILAGQF